MCYMPYHIWSILAKKKSNLNMIKSGSNNILQEIQKTGEHVTLNDKSITRRERLVDLNGPKSQITNYNVWTLCGSWLKQFMLFMRKLEIWTLNGYLMTLRNFWDVISSYKNREHIFQWYVINFLWIKVDGWIKVWDLHQNSSEGEGEKRPGIDEKLRHVGNNWQQVMSTWGRFITLCSLILGIVWNFPI